MAVYTIMEPPRRAGTAVERAERFVFIRDGFSWSAFLFGPVWMLYRRLWLVVVAYAVLAGALHLGAAAVGVGSGGQALIAVLISLLLGFEAATLRRFTLGRRGWRELGSVIGDDRDAAERRFFDAWVTDQAQPEQRPASPVSILRPSPSRPDVIGLFPEPGGSR